jgi:hypothetical protein
LRIRGRHGRERDVVGKSLFEIFPDNPDDALADGVSNLYASLRIVARTGKPHAMAIQRYDIRNPNGDFIERHWQPINTPIHDADEHLIFLLHHVEDVTGQLLSPRPEKQGGRDQHPQSWDKSTPPGDSQASMTNGQPLYFVLTPGGQNVRTRLAGGAGAKNRKPAMRDGTAGTRKIMIASVIWAVSIFLNRVAALVREQIICCSLAPRGQCQRVDPI